MPPSRSRSIARLGLALGLATLIVGCSSPSWRARVVGDAAVRPDHPSEIRVRYVISPADRRITSIAILFGLPRPADPRLGAILDSSSASALGGYASGDTIFLPPEACGTGCSVDVGARVVWLGEPEPELRFGWSSSIIVEYAGSLSKASAVPSSPISVTVLSGMDPTVPRLIWLAVGWLLGGLTALWWLTGGRRFRRTRLGFVVLGFGGLAGSWLWIAQHDSFESARGFVSAYAVVMVMLAVVYAVGLLAARRGSRLAIPIAGAMYVIIVGFLVAVGVDVAPTYRSLELVVLGVAIALPGAAAISWWPDGPPGWAVRP